MPYRGGVTKEPPTFTANVRYMRKMPGAIIVAQLVCCALGFVLAVCSTVLWKVRAGHGFFTFIVFMASISCINWLVIHVFQIYVLFKKELNWNMLGLAHNGVCAFFVMVASCVMVELASAARALRAAGVFGFLGFTGFLAGLAWEVMVWHKNRDTGIGFATATVVRGQSRPASPESGGEDVDLRDEVAMGDNNEDSEIGLVTVKQRPVSSFLFEGDKTSGEMTPMLYAPGNDEDKPTNRPASMAVISERSSDSSVQGEFQMEKESNT